MTQISGSPQGHNFTAVKLDYSADACPFSRAGVWDPLGLIEKRDMRRYEIMEIKHGRAAMLGFIHVIATHAGIRLPGYLSIANDLKFADMPIGCFASLEAVPTAGWLQIMLTTCMVETGAGNLPEYPGPGTVLAGPMGLKKAGFFGEPQLDSKAPGDIGGPLWTRYDDPEVKAYKLNIERNNGRAAMMGITGCLVHELLGVDALYPTGGLGGAAPPPIFS
eukprot:scaffold198329_cov33-Tisochrysis_lutea.AAC.1